LGDVCQTPRYGVSGITRLVTRRLAQPLVGYVVECRIHVVGDAFVDHDSAHGRFGRGVQVMAF